MTDVDFDVIVVGAGVAGSVAAYRLAKLGHSVLLIERGTTPGSKNMSGGILYTHVMGEVFENFASAPVERRITRNVLSFLNAQSAVSIDYWDRNLGSVPNAVSVLRAKFDPWLAGQCEEAGAEVLTGIRVDGLLQEGGGVVGVRAGEDELRSHIVIAADGVNSFISHGAGVRGQEPAGHLALGVKSVIGLPREAIESRFNVRGEEGAAYAVVGDATGGIPGGGFIYTNRDSVSIGVVVQLDALARSGQAASALHDRFLSHPWVEPLLEGGSLLEYASHLTIEHGPRMVQGPILAPGYLVVGDAAGFTLNTGLAIRGMDLAAGSALCAATAAHEALSAGDFSAAAMGRYRAELDASWVGQDMKTYAKAPEFFGNERLYGPYGQALAGAFADLYRQDGTPKRRAAQTVRAAFSRAGLPALRIARDALAAWRKL